MQGEVQQAHMTEAVAADKQLELQRQVQGTYGFLGHLFCMFCANVQGYLVLHVLCQCTGISCSACSVPMYRDILFCMFCANVLVACPHYRLPTHWGCVFILFVKVLVTFVGSLH
jgi:hypothetical protein